MLAFFHSDGKTPVSTHYEKIMANSSKIAGTQIFNIRMLMLSDRVIYLSLSFELFRQYRLERKLQKINNCQSNIVYV